MSHLILVRHGQSEWNLENKFTGWTDVDLTEKGESEAKNAGRLIKNEKIKIDLVFTSVLKRAVNTMNICLSNLDDNNPEIVQDWRLNERHYGSLQGLNKSETAEKYGEDQVLIWRRSYDIPPPLLLDDDKRHPKFNKKFKDIDCELPVGESLKNVIERLSPFLNKYMDHIKNNPGDHLIVAHSNSLRAIVKILEGLSDAEIIEVNIPTGVPLVYKLDNVLNIIDKKYLIDEETLKRKKEIVENQGKIK